EMPVDAIVGDVGDAVLVPFDRYMLWIVGGVLDLARWLVPVDALGLIGPEPIRVLDRALIHGAVVAVLDVGAAKPIGRNVIQLVRHRFVLLLAHGCCVGAVVFDQGFIMRRGLDKRQERGTSYFRCVWAMDSSPNATKLPDAPATGLAGPVLFACIF